MNGDRLRTVLARSLQELGQMRLRVLHLPLLHGVLPDLCVEGLLRACGQVFLLALSRLVSVADAR